MPRRSAAFSSVSPAFSSVSPAWLLAPKHCQRAACLPLARIHFQAYPGHTPSDVSCWVLLVGNTCCGLNGDFLCIFSVIMLQKDFSALGVYCHKVATWVIILLHKNLLWFGTRWQDSPPKQSAVVLSSFNLKAILLKIPCCWSHDLYFRVFINVVLGLVCVSVQV